MSITLEQLIEIFNNLSNWQDRYRQLVLLAKSLPPFPTELQTEHNQIKGCENSVWLTYQSHADKTLTFYAESEGRIVKGLLAILLVCINGKTAEQILALNLPQFFQQFKIIDELSESRQLGLHHIIEKIRSIAFEQLSAS